MRLPLSIIALFALSCGLQAQRVSGPTIEQQKSARAIAFDGQIIFAESFDNGLLGELPNEWSSFSLSNEAFKIGTAGDGVTQTNENGFWPVPFHGTFALTNDDECDCDKSNDRLRSRKFDLTGMQDVQLGFSAFQNGSAGQTAHVEIRATGLSWTELLEIPASSLWEEYRSFIPAQYMTTGFQFRFVYSDNGFYASGLAIDDVFLGVGTEQNIEMKELYLIDGTDGAAADFYKYLPLSQARRADLQLGASAENNSFSTSNAELRTSISGAFNRTDSIGDWLLNPLETRNLSFGSDKTFTLTQAGVYSIGGAIQTDSTDLDGGDNSLSLSLEISDSVYQRHHGEFDGTGIWVLESPDRLGIVYHLFQDDTVKTIRIGYHPACTPGSRYRIKVFSYSALTSSIVSSSVIVIDADKIGNTVDVPVNFGLAAGKYLFVIEKELGRIVISSNQSRKARNGNVLSQKVGQQWKPFPYIPFLSLVMPVDSTCSDFIKGTVEHVTCNGSNDGSISVSLNSGIADTYEWSFVNGNNPNATNLSGDTYSVTITDVTGCKYERSFVLPEPDSIKINPTVFLDTCSQTKGGIQLASTGGTNPLTYNWSNGSLKPFIQNLEAGVYTITVTDNNGCTRDSSITIAGSADFDVAVYIEQPGCGNDNGLLAPDVLGGIGNFDFNWSNGSAADTLFNVTSGVYTVTISDSVGCAEITTIYLGDSTSAALSIASQTDVLCTGLETGQLSVSAVGNAPFVYSWSNGSITDAANNLAAGSYTVTVTDANLCSNVFTASVSETGIALNLDLDAMGILCNGDSNGRVSSYVSGGTAPYSYSWSNGATSESLSNLLTGSYALTVTDANACLTSDSVVISELPIFFIQIDSIVRLNDTLLIPNGAIYTNAFGGTPPYSYSWNNGSTSPSIINLDSGLYSLTVTDQLGCQRTFSELIDKFPLNVDFPEPTSLTRIYPNPLHSGSILSIASEQRVSNLSVLNSNGQNLLDMPVFAASKFLLPKLSPGLYVLEIRFQDGNKEYKHLLIIE